MIMKQELEFQKSLKNKIKMSHGNYPNKRLQAVQMSPGLLRKDFSKLAVGL